MKPVPRPNADTAPYWEACNEERLLYQKCGACGHNQFYPRSICAKCGAGDLAWTEAKPAGVVHSFTVVERAPSAAFKPDAPYVLALVDMEDGYRMMMNVVDCDPVAVEIGMAVRIVFEDRHGQKLPQATPA